MKTYFVAAITALLATGACVDDDASIRILRNQRPDDTCTVSASLDDIFLARGVIDTNATSGYLFSPLLENRSEATDDIDRIYFVEGANVDVRFADDIFSAAEESQLSSDGLTRFVQPLSGSIAAGAFGFFFFEVVSKALLDRIGEKLADLESTTLFIDVEMVGEIGGSNTDSKVFTYPLDVCKGCLLRNLGSCDALPDVEISTGGGCQPLQDGVLDCCTNRDGSVSCPAVAEAPETTQ